MDAFEMALLLDYYGAMLTDKQRQCFDMRYNQDLSLAEIGEELGISRQAVCDNLNRTEALLRRMEENIGYIGRSRKTRQAAEAIIQSATQLQNHPDENVARLAAEILCAAAVIEE